MDFLLKARWLQLDSQCSMYTQLSFLHTLTEWHLNCSIHKRNYTKTQTPWKNENSIKAIKEKIKQKTWYTTERNDHAKLPAFFPSLEHLTIFKLL